MNAQEANLSSIIVTDYGICDAHAVQIGSQRLEPRYFHLVRKYQAWLQHYYSFT